MAELITNQKINWGGANPSIQNKIRLKMVETSRSENGVVMQITDTVIAENSYIEEGVEHFYETDFQVIRNKTVVVPVEMYNSIFENAEMYINSNHPDLSAFQKDILRSKVALWLYVTNDKFVHNDLCIYDTQPEIWEIL